MHLEVLWCEESNENNWKFWIQAEIAVLGNISSSWFAVFTAQNRGAAVNKIFLIFFSNLLHTLNFYCAKFGQGFLSSSYNLDQQQ